MQWVSTQTTSYIPPNNQMTVSVRAAMYIGANQQLIGSYYDCYRIFYWFNHLVHYWIFFGNGAERTEGLGVIGFNEGVKTTFQEMAS